MIPLNSLFFQLAETSFRASLIIAALLLLRPWLRRVIGSKWLCVLWLLVLVRLLVPFSIQSPWSMGSLHSLVQRHELTLQWSRDVMSDTEQTIPAQWQTRLSKEESTERSAALSVEPVSKKSAIAMDIPGVIWVAGALAGFAGLCWRMFQTRRLAARAFAVTDPQVLEVFRLIDPELRRDVELRMNDEVSVPTLVGLRRPQIWLPRICMDQLTSEELRHVLLHELGHARRNDILVYWLFLTVQCLHWFNPLIWIAGRLAKTDREMACDAWVLARASDEGAAEYGLTLLKIVQLLRRPSRTRAVVIEMATSKQELTTRVREISAFRYVAAWRGVMVAIAAVSGLMLVTTTAQTPSGQVNIVGDSSTAPVDVGATTPVDAGTPESPKTVTVSDKGVRVELVCTLFEAPQSVWRRLKVEEVAGGNRNGEVFAGHWPFEAVVISGILPRPEGVAYSNRLLGTPGVVVMKAEKREVAPGKPSIITFPAKDGWARALSIKPRVGPYYDAIDLDLTTQTAGPPMTTPVTILSGQTVLLRSSVNPVARGAGKPEEANEQLFVVTAKVLGKPAKPLLPRPPEPPQIEIRSKFVELSDEAVREFKLESLIYPTGTAAMESSSVMLVEGQNNNLIGVLNHEMGTAQFTQIASPNVTTKSKQRAIIEIIRELRDPDAWEKHPTKPDAWVVSGFETRNVGATLEVEPELKSDGMLSLDLKPQIVEALGFVDLETGRPAPGQRRSRVRDSLGDIINEWPTFPNYEFLPGHRNNMIFSERSAHQNVTLKSGQSVVLVLKEQADIKPFEAEAPKRHLIAIITADVINKEGERAAHPAAQRTAGPQ